MAAKKLLPLSKRLARRTDGRPRFLPVLSLGLFKHFWGARAETRAGGRASGKEASGQGQQQL